MKKILFILIFIFTTIMISAQQTDSATLTLRGQIPPINKININKTNNDFDLSVNSRVNVATIEIISNTRTGYNVTVTSQNDGVFEDDAGNITDTLPYTVEFNDSTYDLSSGEQVIADGTDKTTASGDSNDLFIIYDGGEEFMYEGEYSDTLTFTISAE